MPKKHYFWTKTINCRLINEACDGGAALDMDSRYKPDCHNCQYYQEWKNNKEQANG